MTGHQWAALAVWLIFTGSKVQRCIAVNDTNQQLAGDVRNLHNQVDSLRDLVNRQGSRIVTLEREVNHLRNPSVTTCPPAWRRYGSSCYGLGTEPVSWGDAQEICGIYGGHLAEIESSGENEFLKRMARSSGYKDVWLGAVDVFADGHWVWATDGRPVAFSDWYPGQKTQNARGSQDCLEFGIGGGYMWYDDNCHNNFYFLCEVRLA